MSRLCLAPVFVLVLSSACATKVDSQPPPVSVPPEASVPAPAWVATPSEPPAPEPVAEAEGGAPTPPAVTGFSKDLTFPRRIAGIDVSYTQKAREAKIEGVMRVKCVIAMTGVLENCRIVKGLPYLDDHVLATLRTHRYTPVTFKGRVVSVDKIFTFRFHL